MTARSAVRLRPFRAADTERLLAVVGAVFAEYGMRLDPGGFDSDLGEAHVRYAPPEAIFFAAEAEDGRVLGFAGGRLHGADEVELHRLYIDPAARGLGLGRLLCEAIEDWARERGAGRIVLWSDVRFFHAHAMYRRRGYRLTGQRLLADLDRSCEFGMERALAGAVKPDESATETLHRTPLAEALCDPDLAQRARMVAAAILDARTLVRAGRMERGGHALPEPAEVFGAGPAGDLTVLTLDGGIVVGFERAADSARRLHPILGDSPAPCLHSMARGLPLEALQDEEGARVPEADATGGPVVDAHVHIFPDRVFEALWRWFDRHAWRVRYRLRTEEIVDFLRGRGVSAMVALHYAHAPGMARELNRYAAEAARAHRGFVHALGTVLPGEPGAEDIVREALGPLDLGGLKLHCHVQKLAADDPRLEPIFALCQDAGKPVVIHAGREPRSPAYGIDTYEICNVARVGRVLERFPRLRLVIPHLGADEFVEYAALLDRHENLWLDTTMATAGFFPYGPPADLVPRRAGRLLYGTDFPNIPYAWDRELRRLAAEPLGAADRRALFSANARAVFSI